MQTIELKIQEEIYPTILNFLKLLSPKMVKIKKLKKDDAMLLEEDIEDYNKAIEEMNQGKTTKLNDYLKKRGINV